MTRLRTKRLRRRERPNDVRFLTFSCYRSLALFANDAIKRAFCERVRLEQAVGRFDLYAWTVMPTHVHLLLRPRSAEWTVPSVLHAMKRPFAERVLRRWRRLSAPVLNRVRDRRGRCHFWQPGGGYDRNIVSDEELFEKIEYIHLNAVRAGLVEHAADYPFSSASWYAGEKQRAMIPLNPLPR